MKPRLLNGTPNICPSGFIEQPVVVNVSTIEAAHRVECVLDKQHGGSFQKKAGPTMAAAQRNLPAEFAQTDTGKICTP